MRALLSAWAFAALAIATAGARAQDAHAAQTQATGPRVVSIGFKGSIRKSDVDRLQQAIALAGEEPLPARLIVFFDSGGGDGIAAMQIGRMLRHARAHVFVTGQCASACILAYIGGVYRDAVSGSLGIHRGRITVALPTGRVNDLDPSSSPVARQFLSDAEAQTQDHMSEMGMPPSLFEAMQAVSPQSMRWLNSEEAAQLGLTGFDAAYLAERSTLLSARYGIPAAEYARRAGTVLPHCAEVAARHPAFVACYRKQLLAPQ